MFRPRVSINRTLVLALAAALLVSVVTAEPCTAATLEELTTKLEQSLPARGMDFSDLRANSIRTQAIELEAAMAQLTEPLHPELKPAELLSTTGRLHSVKRRVDQCLEQVLALRTEFGNITPHAAQRTAACSFLRTSSQLIDLSGRLRYMMNDALSIAAGGVAPFPAEREKLLSTLIAQRSSVGAEIMADLLFDPPADLGPSVPIPSAAIRSQVLELIGLSGQSELLTPLAAFVANPKTPPALIIQAAETIRRLGLPQDPRPNQDPTLPAAPIIARKLHQILSGLNESGLPSDLVSRRSVLLSWLQVRMQEGVADDRLQVGVCEVQPGDWLLMRNPSPYNLFTDLSPGLFTHVGVVTLERGSDGLNRMVLIDLPERGTHMPATNIDTFLRRTRHFVLLRHRDPAKAKAMAATARTVIGNPTEFDLNFRTSRVHELIGKPLAGRKITTYCAGLLLLCALETGSPREEFFPLGEAPAGGNTVVNLAQLGLTFGADFISPTGALYSPQQTIVGRREAMYDPRREVEEAVYDYFAAGLVTKQLGQSPDAFQTLRQKVAEASRTNPLLAQALARAANVNTDADLVSAAKAAAVVETLDEIAVAASGDFLNAREAIMAGPTATLAEDGYTPSEIARFKKYRALHPQLYERWEKEQISPRELRIELVNLYIQQGQRQLERRFFSAPAK